MLEHMTSANLNVQTDGSGRLTVVLHSAMPVDDAIS